MKRLLLAFLLVGCAPPAAQPQLDPPPVVTPEPAPIPEPVPTPDPACQSVRLTLRDDVLAVTAADPLTVPPLIRLLVAGVPGLTGLDGIRLPELGLYLQFRPDLTVQEAAPDGWRTCPLP
jgi:hypothetical protein